jgi:hypothetical protein
VLQYAYNLLLSVVNKNELVIVPRHRQKLVLVVLKHSIHELFSLIAQVFKDNLKAVRVLLAIYVNKVNASVRAHDHLEGNRGQLLCEHMTECFELAV